MGGLSVTLLLVLAGEVTALRPLPRGTVIEAGMVTGDASSVLGQQLVRPVFKGKPIGPDDLRAADLVGRQDAVTIRFRRGGLTLDLPGRSLRAGGTGDAVTVLAEGRRRPMRAVVTGPGLVEVAR